MADGGREVERWAALRGLVHRALEVPAERRAAWLEREAGGEAGLAAQALALLALDAAPEGFDAVDPPTRPGTAPAAAPAPRRVGPWQLGRVLGAGGMGVVHLGVRADGSFHQRVAVKLLHAGAGTGDDDARERFRRERQVLANLRHPGIARLIDGGVTEEGLPWLAMEYVEGLPIDRHCDQQRASVRQRVQLFQRVCEAVHEAHKSLVVHRDLKPSNILVTPQGEPKLLDFGIAKVLDPEKTAGGADLTGPFLGRMTPAYASPEQLAGLPITTASDVYSLGVILYKLLCGRLPFGEDARSPVELQRLVCETDPPRPSSAATRAVDAPAPGRDARATRGTPELVSGLRHTTARSLRRALAGDLDRIVLKALRREPARRYASAEQLGADLGNYLAGRPVLARPDSALYRTTRFLGRNRVAAALSAVALLALTGGLVASLALYRRADALAHDEQAARELGEERLAEVRQLASELGEQKGVVEQQLGELRQLNAELVRQEAEAQARLEEVTTLASTMVFDLHREFAALPGSTAATARFLETGLEQLERIQGEYPGNAIFLRDRAAGTMRLAELQGSSAGPNLGRLEQSHASCERAVELAAAAFELAPDEPSVVYCLTSALTLLGSSLERLGRPQDALAAYEEAGAVCALLEEEWRPPGMVHTAHSLHLALTRLLVLLDRVDEASVHLEEAERILPAIARVGGLIDYQRGQVCVNRALIQEARGELAGAVAAATEATEHFARALARTPGDSYFRRAHAMARVQLASLLVLSGEAERALEVLEALEAELGERAAADPLDRQAPQDLDQVLLLTADAHGARGDRAAARAACQRRVKLAEELLARDPGAAAWLAACGEALAALAEAERRLGVLLEAAEHGQAALRAARELVGRDPEHAAGRRASAAAHAVLGRIYSSMAAGQEQPAPRREHLERALGWYRLAREDLAELEQLGAASAIDRGRGHDLEGELAACERALSEAAGG